jgi:transmembrane sensor
LMSAKSTPGSMPAADDLEASPYFMRIGGRSSDSVPGTEKSSRAWIVGIAASLLIVCAGTVFGWMHLRGERGDFYRTEIGVITALPLADGSKITLNTASEIRLVVDRRKREAEVKQGEAFFEVVPDPSRPFTVDAGDRRITVVGTKFSVRREHGKLRVIVTEGKVSVSDSDVILRAGTIASSKDGESMTVQERTPEQAEELLNWREGYVTFDETSLAEAIAEFNRYNTRKLVIADATIASLPVSGHFRWTSIEPFARLLEEGFPVVVAREDDRIVFSARQKSLGTSEPE